MHSALRSRLRELAEQRGFARVGFARAEPLSDEGKKLSQWLEADRHGQMTYMRDTRDVRIDVRHEGMLPSARSVVVFAMPYPRPTSPSNAIGRIARYAHGRDYHNVLHRRLKPLTKLLREEGHAARASVDSMPVFERAWAARAGLGFIGKNACLIVPGLGSHLFLATIVTSAEFDPDEPMRERCGECRACLDVCPTRAFMGPRELDARKCISYLTIEQRGPIDETLREPMGDWLFGCDACQDVCPFNKLKGAEAEHFELDAEKILRMTESEFDEKMLGRPMKRAGYAGLQRNALVVLGNRGRRVHLRVVENFLANSSEVVADAARWAAEQIKNRNPEE